jgi:hypothetical protein
MSVQVLARPVRAIRPANDFARIYMFIAMLAVLVACSLFICGLFVSGQFSFSMISGIYEKFTSVETASLTEEPPSEIITEQPLTVESVSQNNDSILRERIKALIKGYSVSNAEQISEKIFLLSQKHGISVTILTALIGVESGFNNLKSDSGKIGLLPISAAEGQILAAELKIPFMKAALLNPSYNLEIAAYKLAKLVEMTSGSIEKALVAFKAGEFGSDGFAVNGEVDASLINYKDNILKISQELSLDS